jgi:hypothetical protein
MCFPAAVCEACSIKCPAGNWEEINRLCTHGKAFSSVVTQSKGWQMVNEGDEYKPKYGYVTHQVGNIARRDVNLSAQRCFAAARVFCRSDAPPFGEFRSCVIC